jgi:hypothetical protein
MPKIRAGPSLESRPSAWTSTRSHDRGGPNVKTRQTIGKSNVPTPVGATRRSCSEQRPQLGHDLGHDGSRCFAGGLRAPGAPIETAQLIDEDHAGHIADTSKGHLERIALDPARDGANEGQPDPVIEGAGAGRSADRLPDCSRPACGKNDSHTKSPRSGGAAPRLTKLPYPAACPNRSRRGGSRA